MKALDMNIIRKKKIIFVSSEKALEDVTPMEWDIKNGKIKDLRKSTKGE